MGRYFFFWVYQKNLYFVLEYILKIMYNITVDLISISGCGSVWGRFRAPPVADAARKKEWRNKEYREVNNERDDYIATGRALSFVKQTTLKLIRTI